MDKQRTEIVWTNFLAGGQRIGLPPNEDAPPLEEIAAPPIPDELRIERLKAQYELCCKDEQIDLALIAGFRKACVADWKRLGKLLIIECLYIPPGMSQAQYFGNLGMDKNKVDRAKDIGLLSDAEAEKCGSLKEALDLAKKKKNARNNNNEAEEEQDEEGGDEEDDTAPVETLQSEWDIFQLFALNTVGKERLIEFLAEQLRELRGVE